MAFEIDLMGRRPQKSDLWKYLVENLKGRKSRQNAPLGAARRYRGA